jgi:putative ABC transport system permease protein
VLLLALTVAVAALTGVGFLVSRISTAVALQASEVLAADIRLGSPQPIGNEYFEEAKRRGLSTASNTALLSVVFNGDRSQLTNVRAVTTGYPLRGRVLIAEEPFAAGRQANGIPPPGEIWPDSKLLSAIDAHVGSHVSIGAATFRVGHVLISRPDQGAGTFAELAPSLLMNDADLAATQLIQPGSRVSYRALFAGERTGIDEFKAWLTEHKKRGERVHDITDASPQIRNAVERAGRFLSLASLVSVLLCSIAVAMSARRYVHRHLDTVALLKTLGASRAFTLSVNVLQLLAVAVIAAVLGCGAGFLAQEWLLRTLRGLLVVDLPSASLLPAAMGFMTAIAVLIGFALPPLFQLSRTPALRVLRRDVGPPPPLMLLAFGPAVGVVVFLVYWVVRDWKLFLGFTAGLAGFLLVLALAGALLVFLAGRLRGRVGIAWRFGVANLSRRRSESLVQIVAFGTGIMVLLLLSIVRNDLNSDWRRTLPADVPNYFFVNIPPGDRDAFVQFLTDRGAKTARVLPMIRGRLTRIKGRPVEEMKFSGEESENFATREQNLTWAAAEPGADNRLVAGEWWKAADYGKPLVSLSTEIQESLGVNVGDSLAFDIAGESFEVKVASIRKVKWDSFQPNFFVVFAPGVLDKTAGTYITSANLKPGDARSLAQLARRFPSVSIFDIDDLLAQVRSVLDKAVLAVQSVFVFTLFAGLTVLLAAVQSSRDERRYESAMLRTLGARRATVLQGVLSEFTTLGLLSGLLAAIGASVAAYFMDTRVLQLHYTFDWWVFLEGVVGGALLVAATGWLATRSVVNQPPLKTLRA